VTGIHVLAAVSVWPRVIGRARKDDDTSRAEAIMLLRVWAVKEGVRLTRVRSCVNGDLSFTAIKLEESVCAARQDVTGATEPTPVPARLVPTSANDAAN
jgi:hypothetical protein